ncbi:McrC family protein [Sulfurovum mangrovi]|uniref:McrC family protein n=1 Tax=Sulfurovum mangrovi TaxID=2893889 RepID=UPI001E3590A9|nr:McrC family protein [Sulfurovum mangrovi]UFH58478.1 McrC family protein [Sulfurovum mangrovi]
MIKTVDNFNGLANIDKTLKQLENYNLDSYSCEIVKKYKNQELVVSLKDYKNEKYPNNTFFSFFKDEEKKDDKNEDDLIISVKKSKNHDDEDIYLVQTGNYVGKFVWQGHVIDIESRFSNIFLERMLNFANDIFLDDVSVSGKETKNDLNISKYIIYYMFVQNLEKAFLLGLPKAYRSINHHEMKLKGKIDINRFIKHDIPFQGKVSSVSREQKEIQEVIDVLYKAVKIIDKNNEAFTKNISNIKTHIKQYRSNNYVSTETIRKALQSKALQNPIFTPYKKVLEYAKFIIHDNNIQEKEKGTNETYGFLVNMAELFEIYITKLLRNKFPDWDIDSLPLRLDKEFGDSYLYSRKIIPDITMIHRNGKDVMVFDTKYKRMKFNEIAGNGVDIDRCDFFQINTYMNYYNNQEKYNLLVGGLLYPIEEDFDNRFDDDGNELDHTKKKAHTNSWFGSDIKFVIDGIDLSNLNENSNILDFENKFIKRIKRLINQT